MIPDADLYDSESGDLLTAAELGISAEQYESIVIDSLYCGEAEGHIRPDILSGSDHPRVYAA